MRVYIVSCVVIAGLMSCLAGCTFAGTTMLRQNEMLLIESAQGRALIDFISFGPQEGESTYRWRYKARDNQDEEAGEGRVFEKYRKTKSGRWDYTLEDIGSQLTIQAGPIQIEWSYGDEDSFGWLYYDHKQVEVTKLPDSTFESHEL